MYFYCCCITVIFLVIEINSCSGHPKFSSTFLAKESHMKCVEDYILNHTINNIINVDNTIEDLTAVMVRHYNNSLTYLSENDISNKVEEILKSLKSREKYGSAKGIIWEKIKGIVKNALAERCSEEFLLENKNSEEDSNYQFSYFTSDKADVIIKPTSKLPNYDRSKKRVKRDNNNNQYIALPKFPYELPTFSIILNYILVNWLFPLDQIIQTREGRSVLRRYADQALETLMCVLPRDDQQIFRLLIRVLWTRRAHQYFDDYEGTSLFPYPPHFFTADFTIPQPHMARSLYDIHMAFLRNEPRPFSERSLPASLEDVNRILDVHFPDGPGYNNEADIFSMYARFGMSSADYYFESHNDQFYRVLFFILELRARGITTDEEDTYDSPLPVDLMPPEIQAILYSDDLYSIYLMRLRQLYGSCNGTVLRQNLERSSRVQEEYLIEFLITERPTSHIYYVTTTSTTSSTSTTIAPTVTTTTETPVDRKGKRGRLYLCECERHFVKKPRKTFPESCCFHGNSDSSAFDELTDSCLKQQFNYNVTSPNDLVLATCSALRKLHEQKQIKDVSFGFITSNIQELFTKKSSFFTKTIHGLSILSVCNY